MSISQRLTYQEITNNQCWHEEGNRPGGSRSHAVVERLDPFPTQDPEQHHERVAKIFEIPARSLQNTQIELTN